MRRKAESEPTNKSAEVQPQEHPALDRIRDLSISAAEAREQNGGELPTWWFANRYQCKASVVRALQELGTTTRQES